MHNLLTEGQESTPVVLDQEDTEALLDEIFVERPSDSGYVLAETGKVIVRKLKSNMTMDDVCDELVSIGYLLSEANFMVTQLISQIIQEGGKVNFQTSQAFTSAIQASA